MPYIDFCCIVKPIFHQNGHEIDTNNIKCDHIPAARIGVCVGSMGLVLDLLGFALGLLGFVLGPRGFFGTNMLVYINISSAKSSRLGFRPTRGLMQMGPRSDGIWA